MINLEMPKKFAMAVNQAHQVSTEIFRPISRKYDQAEHEFVAFEQAHAPTPEQVTSKAQFHLDPDAGLRDAGGAVEQPFDIRGMVKPGAEQPGRTNWEELSKVIAESKADPSGQIEFRFPTPDDLGGTHGLWIDTGSAKKFAPC